MRIQHNIMAMNAYRNYGNNTSAVAKNLEKLSSGYKINRAGDDAAGLAISEKMRAQITGLNAAQKNVKDGISLVKTAEGAMQEIQDMIKRMKYLATQSANGTYDEQVDRDNLQKEVVALKDEINRIADSANFNGIKLLDGSLASPSGGMKVKSITASAVTDVSFGTGTQFTQTLTIASTSAEGKEGQLGQLDLSYLDKDGVSRSATVSFTYGASTSDTAESIFNGIKEVFGDGYNVSLSGGTNIVIKDANTFGENKTEILNVTQKVQKDGKYEELTANKASVNTVQAGSDKKATLALNSIANDPSKVNGFEIDGVTYQIVKKGDSVKSGNKAIYTDDGKVGSEDVAKQVIKQLSGYGVYAKVNGTTKTSIDIIKTTGDDGKGGLTLQIGDTADEFNQMKVKVGDMHVSALGIESIDISTQSGAAAAIDYIRQATNRVSSVRGDLGAIQNRLEHTQNNLSVMAENIQDAESTIRDTDVADEMMAYTKNNILIQSAQAMLAQANQIPQGVLQLLG